MKMYPLSAAGIESAVKNIAHVIHKTPVLTSATLDAHINRLMENSSGPSRIHFKCENFQKTGSFKCRGAVNAVSKILADPAASKIDGFVTHSSGNHGQALSYAASEFHKKCVVVVPEDAPQAKIDAIAAYGSQIVPVKPTMTARKSTCEQISRERNFCVVDPHDDWDIIEGQGTIAIEMYEQIDGLDSVCLSIGGGGLASGILQWFHERHPQVQVFLVEPDGKDIDKSVQAGERLWESDPIDTIADGVRTRPLGERCFDVVKSCPHHVVSVTNEDIVAAWKLIFERLKIVIEPTAAMPLAAVLKHPTVFKNFKNIGLVVCGGNVNFSR